MKIEIEINRKSFLLGVMLTVLVIGVHFFFFGNTKTVNANSQGNRECGCVIPDTKGGIWYQIGSNWFYKGN